METVFLLAILGLTLDILWNGNQRRRLAKAMEAQKLPVVQEREDPNRELTSFEARIFAVKILEELGVNLEKIGAKHPSFKVMILSFEDDYSWYAHTKCGLEATLRVAAYEYKQQES